MKSAGLLLLLAASFLPFSASQAQGLEQSLVAKWTFKNGSLKSEVGDFDLEARGQGAMEDGAGTITLKGRKYLITPQISSETLPDLNKNITIWARLKFDELPTEGDMNVLGLLSIPSAGDWRDMVLSLIYRPATEDMKAGFAFVGRAADEKELGVGVSRMQPAKVGEFMNVALIYDSATSTASMWVNGVLATSARATSETLRDFAAFGLGQLKAPGGTPFSMTFDEIQIYSIAIDPQWLEEITPTKD